MQVLQLAFFSSLFWLVCVFFTFPYELCRDVVDTLKKILLGFLIVIAFIPLASLRIVILRILSQAFMNISSPFFRSGFLKKIPVT